MKTNTNSKPTNELLLEAIKLKLNKNYHKYAKANKSGGKQSQKWWLCHMYSLKELLKEAEKRKLDYDF